MRMLFSFSVVTAGLATGGWVTICAAGSWITCPMAIGFMLIIALCLGGCSKPLDDREAIQGEWTVVSSESGGEPIPEEDVKKASVSIIRDQFTFAEGASRRTMTFGVDLNQNPKHITLTKWDSRDNAQLGIYELKGDDLKICVDQTSKSRPSTFVTSKENRGVLLLILKRKKP